MLIHSRIQDAPDSIASMQRALSLRKRIAALNSHGALLVLIKCRCVSKGAALGRDAVGRWLLAGYDSTADRFEIWKQSVRHVLN